MTAWAVTACLVCITLCDSALGPTAQDSCDATGNCPPESHTHHLVQPATEDSHHAIAATHRDAEGGLSRLWKSTTSVLQSTFGTAKNTVYNTLVEPTVDRVKTVVREEFFGLIEWLETQVFSPGKLIPLLFLARIGEVFLFIFFSVFFLF